MFNDESYIEQSFFIKKLYILTVNNLSHVYFLKKELNTSLDLCDEAIDIATTYSISKNLNRIFKLKMELLYQLGNIESAVVCYNDAKNLSRILNDVEYIKILEDLVKSQYHSILD